MGSSGCQLAVKNTHTVTPFPAWQQLLLDNEEMLQFLKIVNSFLAACVFFILPVNLWYPQISSRLLFKPLSTEKYFLERLIVFCFSLPPLSPRCAAFPAEPEEKQKEILNNTIPEGKDSGDLLVSHCCQRDGVRSAILLCHCWCS